MSPVFKLYLIKEFQRLKENKSRPIEWNAKRFLTKNNYTFPVVFDVKGEIFRNYYISAFPTTFMIDKDGNIMGYVAGALSKENMKKIIEMTLNNEKK